MALVRHPAEPDIMRRPPRDPRESLVTRRFGARMLGEGALLAAGVLSAYFWVVGREGVGPRAQTIAFLALVLFQPFQAMHCRSERVGWWRLPRNPLIWVSLLVLAALQWWATSWVPLARLLATAPLSPVDWAVAAAAVLWPVLVLEAVKDWGHPASRGVRSPHPGAHGGGANESK